MAAQQGGCRRGPQHDQHMRADDPPFRRKPRGAGGDFLRPRLFMDAARAPWAKFEVLDGIGHIRVITFDPRLQQGAIEQLPRRADKGAAGDVFLSPGCSPTNIMRASLRPSPNTVWVARRAMGQIRHVLPPAPRRAGR